jgi:putative ABC transport system permease protein
MSRFLHDVKYAARTLRRSPGFLAVSLLTLCVTIAANTAIFSVVKAVLLEPISYKESNRIVLVWGHHPRTHSDRSQVSTTEIEDIRRQSSTLEHVSTFGDWTPTLSGFGDSERIPATQVGDHFFDVLGAQPLMGRFFTSDEQIEGKDNVVVLSYGLWRNRFGSDPNIVGKTITLSTIPHTVVGVLPESFRALPSTLVDGGQLYRPVGEPYDPKERDSRHLRAVAKVKQGVTLAQAQAELTNIAARIAAENPKSEGSSFRLVSIYEDTVGNLRTTMYLLSGAVLLLLLIGCANVANLLLARSTARRREIAVRTALGASRMRLVFEMLSESMLLAVCAGALGLLMAYWGTRAFAILGGSVSSQLELAHIDGWVILFCLGTTLFTGVVFGLAPALHASRVSLTEALKSASATSTSTHSRLRNGLIVAEVAMAVVILVCTGLLIRSFHQLVNVDPGFDPKGRLAMNVWLPYSKYKQPEKSIAFYRAFVEKIQALSGVKSAGLVSNPPMGNFDGRTFAVEGQVTSPSTQPEAQLYMVSSDYIRALGIPQVTGRGFTETDNETSAPVAIINRRLAESRFPGQDPVGRKIQIQSGKKENGQYLWRTIVGVVADVKQHGLDQPASEEIYVPYVQMPVTWMTLVVHSSEKPKMLVAPIRATLKELDSDVAPFWVNSYDDVLGKTIATRTFALWLIGGFGAAALLLGMIGIYGVISYSVSQRTKEIGIRMALGAKDREILRGVLWEGLRFTLLGLAMGCAAAFIAARSLESLLYETKPTDATTFIVMACVLTSCALLASFVPARRASSVDPMIALRYE